MTTVAGVQLRLAAEKAVHIGVEEKVPVAYAALLGFQHVLSMFMGVITPPLLLAQMLSLPKSITAQLVSTALLVAALTSFVQIRRVGGIGSGLLSAQGTSFTFLNPLHQVGITGGLPLMLGMSLLTAPVSILLGPFLPRLRRVFRPVVSGTVILLIGFSLIPAGMHDIAAGFGPTAVPWHGLAVAVMIMVIVVTLGSLNRPWARMLAVLIALLAGYGVSAVLGYLPSPPAREWIAWPEFFAYGMTFQWQYVLPFAFLYVVSAIETVGDVTATCQLSGLATKGDDYWSRIRGAVMADGVNSMLAACLGIFPNTTYAQNNGVIQLTGVASRQVGYYMCGFLLLFGLLPFIGNYLAIMPGPVLGGLSLVLFGFVSTGGIRILYYSHLGAREWLILAVALGAGIGVGSVPEVLDVLPSAIAQMFHSSVVTGGLVALFLNAVLPRIGLHGARGNSLMDMPTLLPMEPGLSGARPFGGKLPARLTFSESDWRILAHYWHPIARSEDVREKPVAATLLDQKLVIYRSAEGMTVANDVCLHRGVPLSLGWIENGELVCCYHGFRYDGFGRCTAIPAHPGAAIPPKLCLPTYPVVEKLGLIWTCLSGTPANELPDIPEWYDAEYQHVNPPVVEMSAAAGRQLEGFLDVAHLPWIHHQTFADRSRPVVPAYDVQTTSSGLHMEYESPVGSYLRQDGVEVNSAGTGLRVWDVYLPFAAKLKAFNSGGANPIVLNVASPVHARQTRLFTALLRNYDQDQPVQPYIDFNLRIFSEDREIVEAQCPEDLPLDLTEEVHIRADRTSILYRQELGRLGLGRSYTS